MADYSIFADTSRYLLELLRESLCPALFAARDQISLGAPDAVKNDAQLLLYLYSIRDFAEYTPECNASSHSGMVSNRPLPVTLQYVAFFSKKAQAPTDEFAEHRVLGRVMQTLNANPVLDVHAIHTAADSFDEPATILFSKLDDRQKHDLWGGFSEPMRPAVYFEVGPLLLNGGARLVPRVREMEGDVKRQ